MKDKIFEELGQANLKTTGMTGPVSWKCSLKPLKKKIQSVFYRRNGVSKSNFHSCFK